MKTDTIITYYIVQYIDSIDVFDGDNAWRDAKDLSDFVKPIALWHFCDKTFTTGKFWADHHIYGSTNKSAVTDIVTQIAKLHPDCKWRIVKRQLINNQEIVSVFKNGELQ